MKTYQFDGTLIYKGGWVLVECPHSVVNYYKWWIEKFIWKKISTSYHSPHITIVAGKYDAGMEKHPCWQKYDGAKVRNILYEAKIYTDNDWFFRGEYFWLRVSHPLLNIIRRELGLRPEPFHPFHLTIGYRGY